MSKEHEYDQEKQLVFCVLTTSDTRNVRMTEVVGQFDKNLKTRAIRFLKRGFARMTKWKLNRLLKNGYEIRMSMELLRQAGQVLDSGM